MSTHQYSAGDAEPPVQKETLYLYGTLYDPYGQRVRLVLYHKNIPYRMVHIKLDDKPTWYTQKSPYNTVPALHINDKVLYDSGIIMDYLDEAFPGPKLTPADPYTKAKGSIIVEEFKVVITHFYKLLKGPASDSPATLQLLLLQIGKFEQRLPDTRFMCGDEVTMADYYCWPWVERVPVLNAFYQVDIITHQRCPKLHAWVAAMEDTPGVRATRLSTGEHLVVYEKYRPTTNDAQSM